MTIAQTALETALLERFHVLHHERGFPRADLVTACPLISGARSPHLHHGSHLPTRPRALATVTWFAAMRVQRVKTGKCSQGEWEPGRRFFG